MRSFTFDCIFCIFVLLISFSNIFAIYPNNYTFPLLYQVRIGSQSTEIKLLLNSFNANNILFTNSNRNYYKQISEGRKSDAFMDKLEFNGQIIPDFPFTLIIDNTGLNLIEIQGEFGLGIDKDNKNDLVENLFFNQIINKRKLILEVSNDLKSNNINLDTESISSEFKYCNLTRKIDLDPVYSEAWVSDLSHIIELEDTTVKSNTESIFENANPIEARAVFDTRQKYLIFPTKYLEPLKSFFSLKKCEIILDESLGEKYLQCDKDNIILNSKSIYFIVDGYGLIFREDELFEDDGKYKNSIIRFSENLNKSNLFIFGIPLFKKYNIMFDYDNKIIGFKGEDIYDFSTVYKKWLEKKTTVKINSDNINKNIAEENYKEKMVLIAGIILGSSILLIVFCIHYRKNNETRIHSKLIEEKITMDVPDNKNIVLSNKY